MSFPSETLNIELKEGLSLIIPASYPITLREMYILTAFVSSGLEGKTVFCINFLPGITLEIHTIWRAQFGVEGLEDEWEGLQPSLHAWVEQPEPCINLAWGEGFSRLELWRDNVRPPTIPSFKIIRKLAWDKP